MNGEEGFRARAWSGMRLSGTETTSIALTKTTESLEGMKVKVKRSEVTLTVYSLKMREPLWLLNEKSFRRTKSSVTTVIEAEFKFQVEFLIGEKWRRIQCRPGDAILNRYEAKPEKTRAVW